MDSEFSDSSDIEGTIASPIVSMLDRLSWVPNCIKLGQKKISALFYYWSDILNLSIKLRKLA